MIFRHQSLSLIRRVLRCRWVKFLHRDLDSRIESRSNRTRRYCCLVYCTFYLKNEFLSSYSCIAIKTKRLKNGYRLISLIRVNFLVRSKGFLTILYQYQSKPWVYYIVLFVLAIYLLTRMNSCTSYYFSQSQSYTAGYRSP